MPRKTTTADVAAKLFGKHSTAVLDVGARWGAEGAWYRISPLARVVGFEPDRTECDRLNRLASPGGGERFYPVALGETEGPATLHITEEPGCSSLLAPNEEAITRYPLLRVMTPRRSVEVSLRRLDTWAREEGCDEASFIKVDTQGTELSILRGAGELLDTCLGVEAEVEFFPLYTGQPLFADVEQHLRSRGLVLWRLSNLVHYSERHSPKLPRKDVAVFNGVSAPSMAGSGRLCWANALFFRDHRTLPTRTLADVRKLVILASLFDAAGELDALISSLQRALTASREVLDDTSRQVLTAHLREIEREF